MLKMLTLLQAGLLVVLVIFGAQASTGSDDTDSFVAPDAVDETTL